MARTQSENYGEIRRDILRKAAALFARLGYPNTTIAALAEGNGISRGLLYHYFESKETLLAEMLSDHLEMLLAATRAAAEAPGSIEERFRETIRTMVEINAESQDLQIVLLHDLQNLGPAERAAIVRKQKRIIAIVSGLVDAYDAKRRGDRRTLMVRTMMLVGMINYTYLWFDPKGPVTPAEYAELVADTYLAGVRA